MFAVDNFNRRKRKRVKDGEGRGKEDQLKSNFPLHSLRRRSVLLREIMNTCLRIQPACPRQTTRRRDHDIVVSFRASQTNVTQANTLN